MNISENYDSCTIADAIKRIDTRGFLLPAIQRKFVWRRNQIEDLFDSLLQGYPINTMMVWNVTSPEVKKDFQFYSFLDRYCERLWDKNLPVSTVGFPDFSAVIDGQQRLTSIYIGLKSSYAVKKKNKHWTKSEDPNVFPQERLYVDLKAPNQDEGISRKYTLAFLSEEAYRTSQAAKDHAWFQLGDILNYRGDNLPMFLVKDVPAIIERLGLKGSASEQFAMETLCKIYELVWQIPTIHFYKEADQDIDRVMNVFIRTNSGGTKLSMSALLMSVAIAKWNDDKNQQDKTDPRAEIEDLVKSVWQDSSMSFSIDQDWVLKTCLYLTDADIKFKVRNFTKECVTKIRDNWPDIRDAIRATFEFLNKMGVKDRSLRAKNAVIPLVYYLYTKKYRDGNPLYKVITRMKDDLLEDRRTMVKWLNIVTLKSTFGGQSDAVLASIRKVIADNANSPRFPFEEIVERFKGTRKDIRFNSDEVDFQLLLRKDDQMCRPLLMILFPEVNVQFNFDIDHLHPKNAFKPENLKKCEFLANNEELMNFYRDSANWDTVPNLHLLIDSPNRSKQDRPLKEWIDDPQTGFTREGLLIPADVDLSFEKFPEFLQARKAMLKKRFAEAVGVIADTNIPDEAEEPAK